MIAIFAQHYWFSNTVNFLPKPADLRMHIWISLSFRFVMPNHFARGAVIDLPCPIRRQYNLRFVTALC